MPRPVAALANSFPAGHYIAPHHHPRAQLIYGLHSVMTVRAAGSVWTVPASHALCDAYLGALSTPPEVRFDKRLRGWFDACERYPLQLRELPQDEYLAMKRREFRAARLQSSAAGDAALEGEATVK